MKISLSIHKESEGIRGKKSIKYQELPIFSHFKNIPCVSIMDPRARDIYSNLVERLYANRDFPVKGGLSLQEVLQQIRRGEREKALGRVLCRIGRDGWDASIKIARNSNLDKYSEEIYRVFSSVMFTLHKTCGKYILKFFITLLIEKKTYFPVIHK